jgi:REP element-mobilizing transposase RayT
MQRRKRVPLAPRSGSQLGLSYEKLDKNGQHRGGRRKGSGRKRTVHTLGKGKRYERHVTRAAIDRRQPQHVTFSVVSDITSLRTMDMYAVVKHAIRVSQRDDFQIVHHSVQGNHIHLAVEADDNVAMAKGMKSFAASFTQRTNAAMSKRLGVRRKGRVIADRYHVVPITSVRGVRNALCYIFNNWRHHAQSTRNTVGLYEGRLDPYSSAIWFEGWKERTTPEIHVPADYDPPPRPEPRTWLLREGWRRAAPISCWETPG